MLRISLGIFLAFGALNAFGGGFYGLMGAEGVPRALLAGSPFASYFVPSLVLFVVVGGSLLFASLMVLRRSPLARPATLAAGLILLGWIVIQVAIIGFVSVLQPVVAGAAVVILAVGGLVQGR